MNECNQWFGDQAWISQREIIILFWSVVIGKS